MRRRGRARANSDAAKTFWQLAKQGQINQTYREFLAAHEQRIQQVKSHAVQAPKPQAAAPAKAVETPSIIHQAFDLASAADDLRAFLEKYINTEAVPGTVSIAAPSDAAPGVTTTPSNSSIATDSAEASTDSNPSSRSHSPEAETDTVAATTKPESSETASAVAAPLHRASIGIRDENVFCFATIRSNVTNVLNLVDTNPSAQSQRSSGAKAVHKAFKPEAYTRHANRRHFLQNLQELLQKLNTAISIDFKSSDLIQQTIDNKFSSPEAAEQAMALCAGQMFGQIFNILAQLEICRLDIELFIAHTRNVSAATAHPKLHQETFTTALTHVIQCAHITQHIASDLFNIYVKFKLLEFEKQYATLTPERQGKLNKFKEVSNPLFSTVLATYSRHLPLHCEKMKTYGLAPRELEKYFLHTTSVTFMTDASNKRQLDEAGALQYAQAFQMNLPGLSFFTAKIAITIQQAFLKDEPSPDNSSRLTAKAAANGGKSHVKATDPDTAAGQDNADDPRHRAPSLGSSTEEVE